MPRISAPTIAEHVAAQEQAVFDAAVRLFMERPVAEVSVADIAREAGLARTSLYRYFPTKASIVHRWFDTAVAPLVVAGDAIADSSASSTEKLGRWVQLHLDLLGDERHRAMIRAARDTDDMPNDVRVAITAGHQQMYASLNRILSDEGIDPDIVPIRVALIAGALRSVVDMAERGIDLSVAGPEIMRTAMACL